VALLLLCLAVPAAGVAGFAVYQWLSPDVDCGAAGELTAPEVTVDEMRDGAVVVELGRSPDGAEISYTVRATDDLARTYRWPDLEIEAPDGETTAAWGDDSVLCNPVVAPDASGEEEGVPAFGGFGVPPEPGGYTVLYDGEPVGEVRIEG
jgi:hypothetical protein